MGGATAAVGNLIAFNTGPGVDVEGDASVGDQVTSNRIFDNEESSTPSPDAALAFQGSSYVSLPRSTDNSLIEGTEFNETLEARFQTTSGGVILGYQAASPGQYPSDGWVPELYVGTDGKLYAGAYDGTLEAIEQVTSKGPVDDGQWHDVALVIEAQDDTMTAYLDGQLLGTVTGSPQEIDGNYDQIGTGYTDNWPATPGGWYGFVGEIDDVRVWGEVRTAAEIGQDMTTRTKRREPGLLADDPLDDGEGTTAYDLTSNHNDGTLGSTSGPLPAWVTGDGEAIDLGGDGITENAGAPRQGPDDLQNFPVLVATANGLEGWLGGSAPRHHLPHRRLCQPPAIRHRARGRRRPSWVRWR